MLYNRAIAKLYDYADMTLCKLRDYTHSNSSISLDNVKVNLNVVAEYMCELFYTSSNFHGSREALNFA